MERFLAGLVVIKQKPQLLLTLLKKKAIDNHWTNQIKRQANTRPVPKLSFFPAPYRGWTRAGETSPG